MAEITYGQGAVSESSLRLVPELNENSRVIELGIGQNLNPVAFAEFGCRTIVVDPDETKVKELRIAADMADVRIECHTAEFADLGFATTGSIDLVVANQTLPFTEDLGRALRQINRVLKSNRPLILAVNHPYALAGGDERFSTGPNFDSGPAPTRPLSIGDWFTQLSRTNFRVDQIIEVGESSRAGIPQTLVMRARKEGD